MSVKREGGGEKRKAFCFKHGVDSQLGSLAVTGSRAASTYSRNFFLLCVPNTTSPSAGARPPIASSLCMQL